MKKVNAEPASKNKELAQIKAAQSAPTSKGILQKGKEAVGSAYAKGKAAAGQGAGAVKKFAGTKTGKGIGIALAVAAATAAAYAAYKRFFSKAAKECKGAADRSACIKNFKKKAAMAKAQALQAGMSKCASSSNPEGCRAAIAKKVAKAKAEAAA
jgi:hypothetical protein